MTIVRIASRCKFIVLIGIFFLMTFSGLALATDEVWEEPRFLIGEDYRMPVFNAGEKASLYVPVENTTSGTARDLVFSIVVSDPETFPFEMKNMSLTRHISSFSGKHRSLLGMDLFVRQNVKPGTYPVNVTLDYRTGSGGGGSASAVVYVKIVNDYQQPDLQLTGVTIAGDEIKAGQSEVVKLNIKNGSDLDLYDVELKLNGFSPTGLNLDKWSDTQKVQIIKAGELHPVEFIIGAHKDMTSGTYTLDLGLKYKDEYDVEYTGEKKVYLPVVGKGESDLTPRIIVDNYYYGSDYVEPGQVFDLCLGFFNTSEEKEVCNIKVSLNAEGQGFSPVGNSNSIYIDRINPREQVERVVSLKPQAGDQQTGNITINIDYQDEEGNKYTETEIISIAVEQETKLVVAEVELPPEAYVGSPVGISVDFYNTGRAKIRNLIVSVEGDFEAQDRNLYIGNVEPGGDDYFDTTIFPRQEGELKGKIVLKYEDEQGKSFQTDKEFAFTVMKPMEPPMNGPEGMPEDMEKPGSWFKWWMLAVAGAVLVLVVGFIVYRRKKKKRQQEEFLDE